MTVACGNKFNRVGFSLVELLVVLALLVVMVSMMNSRGSRSYQQQRMATCEKNLQTIYTAFSLYAPEQESFYPLVTNPTTSEQPLSLLVPRYTTVTEIFICPGSKDPALPAGESFVDRKISYAYYMGLNKSSPATQALVTDEQINTNAKKSGALMFSTDGKGAGNNHDKFGGNILFADGSITSTKAKLAGDFFFPQNVVLLNPKP